MLLTVFKVYCYRPQRNCGQGNIFTPVCHSVHRGVCLSACWDTTTPGKETPPARRPPQEGDTPRRRHPPAKETPWEGDPLQRRPPRKEAPLQRRTSLPPCQGDPPLPRRSPPQAHTQGGNLRGIRCRSAPKGKLRGIRSRPTPKGGIEGIRSRPTTKVEIEGDQIQAHTQGGN